MFRVRLTEQKVSLSESPVRPSEPGARPTTTEPSPSEIRDPRSGLAVMRTELSSRLAALKHSPTEVQARPSVIGTRFATECALLGEAGGRWD